MTYGTELKVFHFRPTVPPILPADWEIVNAEFEEGNLWVIAKREYIPYEKSETKASRG